MLVDIFARRYDGLVLRDSFDINDRRILLQSFRILEEDIYPYYYDGKERPESVAFWTALHSTLSRELGLKELSSQWFSYTTKWNGNDHIQTHKRTMVAVCESWMTQELTGTPDVFIKERLSLIEIGFRSKENDLASMNAKEISEGEIILASLSQFGNGKDGARARREKKVKDFQASVEELNTRFRQAGYPLNYHNGFIQLVSDDLVQTEVETPFWSLLTSPKWKNVDSDMKEALDLRDRDGKNSAFFAAKALESTIKIISDAKGWTQGNERGAHNYIENLSSKKNSYIDEWESFSLKGFFSSVRNKLGHGPGSSIMPNLSQSQTEWAIEFCMIWIKSLIKRFDY